MILLLKSIILGFAVAAPVGPINLLCMRRTLVFGRQAGIVSGLGAALADAFFATIAAFGFTAVSRFLVHYSDHIHIFGGIILCVIAWRIYHSKITEEKVHDRSARTLWKYFLTSFFLTLTNPTTVFSFIALFAGIGVGGKPLLVVIGVFLGSMVWWTILTYGIAKLNISNDKFTIVNKVAAVLIFGVGIISFLM